MKKNLKFLHPLITSALITLVFTSPVRANTDEQVEASASAAQAIEITPAVRIEKAVKVLEAQMNAPAEKRISGLLLKNAQCIVVIPGMVQGGIGFGLKHGAGVISCRHDDQGTWGVPAFIRLSGASIGAQLGIQTMDVMMLSMTDNGLNQLLSGKPILSGDAGVSVGPVGRNAEIAMDVLLQTPLLSYTRSKGFYAGATMGGSLFTTAKKVNREIYGEYENARELLLAEREIPSVVQPFIAILQRYAPVDIDE